MFRSLSLLLVAMVTKQRRIWPKMSPKTCEKTVFAPSHIQYHTNFDSDLYMLKHCS